MNWNILKSFKMPNYVNKSIDTQPSLPCILFKYTSLMGSTLEYWTSIQRIIKLDKIRF